MKWTLAQIAPPCASLPLHLHVWRAGVKTRSRNCKRGALDYHPGTAAAARSVLTEAEEIAVAGRANPRSVIVGEITKLRVALFGVPGVWASADLARPIATMACGRREDWVCLAPDGTLVRDSRVARASKHRLPNGS